MKTEDLKNYIFKQLNEVSYKTATNYSRARGKRGQIAYNAWELARMQAAKLNLKNTPQRDLDALSQAEDIMGKISRRENDKAITGWERAGAIRRREAGLPPTSTQESAFNFINGLKRLQEAKKFPPITMEELQSPGATKHHARRGVKHSDPKVAIEALKLAFRLNDAKTAWMGKDHLDQEVRDTAEMSMNMDEN